MLRLTRCDPVSKCHVHLAVSRLICCESKQDAMIVFLNEETELGAMTDSDGGVIVSKEDECSSSSWLASVMPTNFGQAFSRKSSKDKDEQRNC